MGATDPTPRSVAPPFVLAPGHTGIGVLGIEVTQAVQDLANSVTLVAGKATVVRVYVDQTASAAPALIRGELAWHRDGTAESTLTSLNVVPVFPAATTTLDAMRRNANLSLNFPLPPEATAAGRLTVRLSLLRSLTGAEAPPAGTTTLSVDFQESVPLIVRVVGLRYAVPATADAPARTVAPDAADFDFLRSYLRRAYPVPSVEWSQIVVDADFAPPFDDTTADKANPQVAALRGREVGSGSGFDPRTHYYGLVSDDAGRHFMRGKGMHLIDGSPDPSQPASGPAGAPRKGETVDMSQTGDTDVTYGDWYGAHELAHTLGRLHPGFPVGGQDSSDPAFPYPNGQLSPDDGQYVGFDVGDPQLGIRMAALPGTKFHDIMTYSDNQWVCPYTYLAILTRLTQEAALTAPADAVRSVRIVATVDLENRTGEIRYVNPAPAAAPTAPASGHNIELQVRNADGDVLHRVTPALAFGCGGDIQDARRALVQEDLPAPPDAQEIVLIVDGEVRARHIAGSLDGDSVGVTLGDPAPARPHLRALSADVRTAQPGVTYVVQGRAGDDLPWQTLAVGRPTPDLEIDVNQFPGARTVDVRVLATNGFADAVVGTRQLQVGDSQR